MITAFEGWNDAGEAATDAVDHLRQCFDERFFAEIDPNDYYDFQVSRPHIHIGPDLRKITWPTTKISIAAGPDRDLVLVHGIEPNLRWPAFCAWIIEQALLLKVELVINIGAMLADVPHTRPTPTTAFATDERLIDSLDVEPAAYEGPTGIVGVLQQACDEAGVAAVSLWTAIPHYVANSPCPKATLALLGRLSDLIGLEIPVEELIEDATAWQLGVEEMAAQDSDITEYVERLERARDSEELSKGSGEAIAAEFERYLRRHDSL